MNRIHVGWSVVVVLGVALVVGCGSGENPNVPLRTDNRLTSRASGTITFLGLAQNLSLANSYAVAVQDPQAFQDQWTLYVIFGMRGFNPLAVPQGVLAIFLDQVNPNIPTSIEVPAGQVRAALHTNFQNLPVAQQTNATRTVMNIPTGGYFIIEAERSRGPSDTSPLQIRLHDFALSSTEGTGVVLQAQIPYRLTNIPTSSFLLYVNQLGVDQPPASTGSEGGGGTFPPSPPSGGGGGGGGGGFPPPPPSY
jgi:hypothetical protein